MIKKIKRLYTAKKHSYYLYICECGNLCIKRGDSKAKYCSLPNCKYSKYHRHGFNRKNEPLYSIWESMMSRCHGSHHSNKHYKDRGIKVCDEWRLFENFRKWAYNNNYKPGLTIDRINIDGDYEPNNCEFVTRSENTRRQLRDRHPTSKTVLCFRDDVFLFKTKSIRKMAEKIKTITKTTKRIKTVEENIRKVIKEKRQEYLGFNFKEEAKSD